MQAEIERMEREKELEKAREAERQKKLDEAAAKQRAREKEIEEREVSIACCTHCLPNGVTVSMASNVSNNDDNAFQLVISWVRAGQVLFL